MDKADKHDIKGTILNASIERVNRPCQGEYGLRAF
jgi:hypothetical protein